MPPTASAVLRGRDHQELDRVAVEEVGGGALAVALTRGRHPKATRAVDPNEDVVAAVAGRRTALLVVADGHYGEVASRVAVDVVVDALGTDPAPADLPDRDLVDLYERAGAAVRAAAAAAGRERRDSSTTLALALVAPAADGVRVQWASLGDSAVFVAGADAVVEVTTPRLLFLGEPLSRFEVAGRLERGLEVLDGDDPWVVLATDGLTNFVPDAAGAVAARLMASDGGPTAVARGLVDDAGDAGAGDNVGVAVAAAAALGT